MVSSSKTSLTPAQESNTVLCYIAQVRRIEVRHPSRMIRQLASDYAKMCETGVLGTVVASRENELLERFEGAPYSGGWVFGQVSEHENKLCTVLHPNFPALLHSNTFMVLSAYVEVMSLARDHWNGYLDRGDPVVHLDPHSMRAQVFAAEFLRHRRAYLPDTPPMDDRFFEQLHQFPLGADTPGAGRWMYLGLPVPGEPLTDEEVS